MDQIITLRNCNITNAEFFPKFYRQLRQFSDIIVVTTRFLQIKRPQQEQLC
jgi:hypothetical protein